MSAGPSDADVVSYGRSVGVDVARYPALRPFVLEGFNAPLPEPWVATKSTDVLDEGGGDVLFYNQETGVCIAEHPHDRVYRAALLDAMRRIDAGEDPEAVANSLVGPTTAVPPPPAAAGPPPPPMDVDVEFEHPAPTAAPGRVFDVDVPDSDSDSGDAARAAPPSPPAHRAPAQTAPVAAAPPVKEAAPLPPAVEAPRDVPSPSRRVRPATAAPVEMPDVEPIDHGEGSDDHYIHHRRQVTLPAEFVCPITAEVMQDPVVAMDGFSYERAAIERWFAKSDTSPCTNAVLPSRALFPNTTLRNFIRDFVAKHHIDCS